MKVNFNLKQPDKNNNYCIYLFATIYGVRLFQNTLIKVKKSEWDEIKHRIKSAERSVANAKLSEYEQLAFKFMSLPRPPGTPSKRRGMRASAIVRKSLLTTIP